MKKRFQKILAMLAAAALLLSAVAFAEGAAELKMGSGGAVEAEAQAGTPFEIFFLSKKAGTVRLSLQTPDGTAVRLQLNGNDLEAKSRNEVPDTEDVIRTYDVDTEADQTLNLTLFTDGQVSFRLSVERTRTIEPEPEPEPEPEETTQAAEEIAVPEEIEIAEEPENQGAEPETPEEEPKTEPGTELESEQLPEQTDEGQQDENKPESETPENIAEIVENEGEEIEQAIKNLPETPPQDEPEQPEDENNPEDEVPSIEETPEGTQEEETPAEETQPEEPETIGEPAEEEELPVPEIEIHSTLEGLEVVEPDTEVTLTAALLNYDEETMDYTARWMYSTDDGETFTEIEGETALTFTYRINADNIDTLWRIVVTYSRK